MLPGTRDITLYQGDTFVLDIRLREKTVDGQAGAPIDLTGASINAQVRVSEESTGSPLVTFTSVIGTLPGTAQLKLTNVQTALMTGGIYDMQVTFPDGTVTTFLRGNVTVQPDVSHA